MFLSWGFAAIEEWKVSMYSRLFNCLEPQVVMHELPQQIALGFTVTGCNLRCKGCHSAETWNPYKGQPLNDQVFEEYLDRYQGLITAVVFFGGEWNESALKKKLKIAKQRNLVTCLYSGEEHISRSLVKYLDFYKTGSWQRELGGLDSDITNQKFCNAQTGEILNQLFQRQKS